PVSERNRRVGLHRMAQDVEASRGSHRRRRRTGVVGIEKAERRLQQPGRDSGLHVQPCEVENGYARGLAAGARGRRNGKERFERTRNRKSLTDRLVFLIEESALGCGRYEIFALAAVPLPAPPP